MSYQQQGQQGGYGQYNPYGEQGNPYQSGGGYGNTDPYSTRPEPQHHSSSRYNEEEAAGGAGSYQMTNMNGSNGQGQDHILNEVRNIDRAIDDIENNLQRLTNLQSRSLNDTDTSANSSLNRELDALNADTMTKYRGLVQRVRTIKSNPESGNPRNSAQVGKVDRRLKTAINQYQQVERDHRRKMQDQIARQYRIVRPDASDAEVREAVEDTSNQQVFSDALINSDRRGQAQSVAQNVRSRHQNIQKIEQDMMILAQLFQDLEALVVQQEPAVTNIEQKGEEVNDHVQGANTELDGAVKKARAARRKKWYCLGICVLIIIIIVVVVVVVVEVTKK